MAEALAARLRAFPADFWNLFQGQLVSNLGTQAFQVMALYWLSQKTGSPAASAAFLTLSVLPPVLLGPWLASRSGQFAPRSILMTCDTLSGLCAVPLVIAMGCGAPRGLVEALLLMTAALLSTVNAVLLPNLHAAVPLLVERERLPHANSAMLVTQQLATVVGQGLGGLLYALLGPVALCAITSLGFWMSTAAAGRMRSRAVLAPASLQAKPRPVFAMLMAHPGLRRLTGISAVFNLLYAPWIVLLPFHLAPQGGLRPQTFGLVLAAYGLGNLLGAAAVKPLLRRFGAPLLGASLVAQAVVLVVLGLAATPVLIGLVLVAMGAGISIVNVQVVTRAQTCVPQAEVAKAMAVMRTSVHLATPLGFAVAAAARGSLGLSAGAVYVGLGLVLLAAMIVLPSATPRAASTASPQPAE